MLLDEATSSLDSKTDTFLQEMVRSAFVDRTLLLISHRPENTGFDKVLKVEDGKVSWAGPGLTTCLR